MRKIEVSHQIASLVILKTKGHGEGSRATAALNNQYFYFVPLCKRRTEQLSIVPNPLLAKTSYQEQSPRPSYRAAALVLVLFIG